ncbi:MAG: hypothetical protein P1P82_18165 [Bacteroidales bacterium]|nr:hypothetical protein [Bacteroidales bacterium]MDT8433107.1 hypothetical protein [Bacteroidales bacterium]
MIRQIKSMALLFALVFPSLLLSAQDSVSLHEAQSLDSIRKVLANDYARQLNRYRELSEQEAASNRAAVDSLEESILEMDREIRNLAVAGLELRSELDALEQALEQNTAVFEAERQRFARLLLIAGPSLLTLILLSTVLFFLLIRRQQESTDFKINALKKYTYTEIEETRTDLSDQFRKRVKKLREKLKGKDGKKMEKVPKVKTKKAGKEKSGKK